MNGQSVSFEPVITRDVSLIAWDIEISLKAMPFFKDLSTSYDKHHNQLHIGYRLNGGCGYWQLRLKICGPKEFEETYNGSRSISSINGFVNRRNDVSEAFVKESGLEDVLETTGHELGHLMIPEAMDQCSEEAKAYAFQQLFCLNLPMPFCSLQPIPKKTLNPTHQSAYDFVVWELILGKTPEQIIDETRRICVPTNSGHILANTRLYFTRDKKTSVR